MLHRQRVRLARRPAEKRQRQPGLLLSSEDQRDARSRRAEASAVAKAGRQSEAQDKQRSADRSGNLRQTRWPLGPRADAAERRSLTQVAARGTPLPGAPTRPALILNKSERANRGTAGDRYGRSPGILSGARTATALEESGHVGDDGGVSLLL
jgi:hypothetical protein